MIALALPLATGCPRGDSGPAPASPPAAAPGPTVLPGLRVTVVDPEDRPVSEARLANLPADAFDGRNPLRAEAAAASPGSLRVVVEDSSPAAPATISIAVRPSGPALSLPLSGPPNRRVTPPFLLLGDREDAAASSAALAAAPGSRIDLRYRDTVVGELKVGPSVIHEIPVRVVAVGPGLPPAADFEQALDLRLRQANAVWEPFGRRFIRTAVSRVDSFKGLVLVRGRAAGVDGQGRPSHSGLKVEGRELLIPCPWRDDGAPLTPKAAARALAEKAGASVQPSLFDGLAGDREAVVIRWRRRDGSPAAVEGSAASNDIAQAVTPLAVDLLDGLEVAPTGSALSLEEAALLATGKAAPAEGFDLFVVASLHSLQAQPAFKVYPEASFPAAIAGSAAVSWSVLDGSGRYPYALARLLGELLLPPSLRPAPEDTLFADPLSETTGVDARKRLSAATGSRIAERGRGLSGRK